MHASLPGVQPQDRQAQMAADGTIEISGLRPATLTDVNYFSTKEIKRGCPKGKTKDEIKKRLRFHVAVTAACPEVYSSPERRG